MIPAPIARWWQSTLFAAALALPIAIGMVNAPSLRAQSSSSSQKGLTFDVASVKPTTVPDGVTLGENGQRMVHKGSGTPIPRNTGGPGTEDPGRIHYGLISLKELLRQGWSSYYEIEGPGWLGSQVVTVDATMPPSTTKEQFQEMLRNLITERLGLKYHAETKDVAGYALTVAKNGPKMKESADQSDAGFARPQPPTRSGPDGFPILTPSPGKLMVSFGKRRPGPRYWPAGDDERPGQVPAAEVENHRNGRDRAPGEI